MTWEELLAEAQMAFKAKQWITGVNTLVQAAWALRRELTPAPDPSQPLPQVVHYTRLEVLYLILKAQIEHAHGRSARQGGLRLYDSIHLRDPKEGNFLIEQISEQDLLDHLIGTTDPGAYILSVIQTGPAHFRDGSDHLMLWRAYGDDGRGCSITFDYRPDWMHPVRYGDGAAKQAAASIDRVLSVAHSACAGNPSRIAPPLKDALRHLLNVRYYYKHGAYDLECEARATSLEIHRTGSVPVFQYRHPYIRHYVDHPGLQGVDILNSTTVITLGPSVPEQANAARSVRQMLQDARLRGPEVRCSPLPYVSR